MARTHAQRARYKEIQGIVFKHCPGCDKWKNLEQYYQRSDHSGVKSRCKQCYSEGVATRRNGSYINRGLVPFHKVDRYLRLVVKLCPSHRVAAEIMNMSRSRLSMYLNHPPLMIRRQTAGRIILAAQTIKGQRNGN